MFPFKNQEMVSDEDLEKIGMSSNDNDLYNMPDELIYKSYLSEQESMKFTERGGSRPNSDQNYYSAANG